MKQVPSAERQGQRETERDREKQKGDAGMKAHTQSLRARAARRNQVSSLVSSPTRGGERARERTDGESQIQMADSTLKKAKNLFIERVSMSFS